jgi:hypothetical protein
MTTDARRPAMPGKRKTLFWLLGALAAVSAVYLSLPKSWFELEDVTKRPPPKNAAGAASLAELRAARGAAGEQGSVCPVNPRGHCIPCHMPARQLFPDTRIPIAMADHLILAYRHKRGGDARPSSPQRPNRL